MVTGVYTQGERIAKKGGLLGKEGRYSLGEKRQKTRARHILHTEERKRKAPSYPSSGEVRVKRDGSGGREGRNRDGVLKRKEVG